MHVELPSNFAYYTKKRAGHAHEENGFLYLEGPVSWEKVAYDLCYAIKGRQRCRYCGARVKRRSLTVDHMFPRYFGGVSIPENLLPACTRCNSLKGDMNYHEYKKFRKLQKGDRAKFKEKMYAKKTRIRYRNGFDLPKRWISTIELSKIIVKDSTFIDVRGKKYQRVEGFFRTYRHLPNPIVLSSNNVLLEGHTLYAVAQNNRLKFVPIIRLDNVVVKL